MPKTKQLGKDYTKYTFLGEQYGKGTLVLAVVKKYLEEHPEATVKKLNEVFTKKETGSTFDVVVPVRKAVKGRFFINAEDLIKAADRKVAVTSQWSKDNIKPFIVFAQNILHTKIAVV